MAIGTACCGVVVLIARRHHHPQFTRKRTPIAHNYGLLHYMYTRTICIYLVDYVKSIVSIYISTEDAFVMVRPFYVFQYRYVLSVLVVYWLVFVLLQRKK